MVTAADNYILLVKGMTRFLSSLIPKKRDVINQRLYWHPMVDMSS